MTDNALDMNLIKKEYVKDILLEKRIETLKKNVGAIKTLIKDILTSFGYDDEAKEVKTLKDLESLSINSQMKEQLIKLIFDAINLNN